MVKLFDIFNPHHLNGKSLSFFCFQTFLIITPGTILAIFLVRNFLLMLGVNDAHAIPLKSEIDFNYFIKIVIFAPVIETLILSLLIKLVSMFFANKIIICFISAAVFTSLHGMNGINTIVGPFILFFSFSHSFILWRKHSYKYAYIAACMPHVLNNLLAFLIYCLSYSPF